MCIYHYCSTSGSLNIIISLVYIRKPECGINIIESFYEVTINFVYFQKRCTQVNCKHMNKFAYNFALPYRSKLMILRLDTSLDKFYNQHFIQGKGPHFVVNNSQI